MKTVSVAEAKNRLPELVHGVEVSAPIQITRRGQPVAVLLSASEYERLQASASSTTDFADWAQAWRGQLPGSIEGITQDELTRWREL